MVLPEIVAVGIYNSDVAAKDIVISKNRKTSMFEIELPIEDGGISYIETGSKQIHPNMIICAKPGQIRHTKFPYKCFFVHMIIHDGVLYDTLINTPDFFETNKGEKYKKIFTKMIKSYNTLSKSEEIIVQSLILELIYNISKDIKRKLNNDKLNTNYTIVEESIKYVKEHLTEDLNLNNIAHQMSLSPIHFHNTFKKAVGKTLRDYIEEQRIKKATNLLLSTNYSLTQIAYECGFSSQSYFSYVFKRRMKVTPRQYVQDIYDKYEI